MGLGKTADIWDGYVILCICVPEQQSGSIDEHIKGNKQTAKASTVIDSSQTIIQLSTSSLFGHCI
jgi:hypothetical protein